MATKNKEKAPANPASQTIEMMVIRPARIQTEDISTWVEAVNSAKMGYRQKLYNLYENILADPILGGAVDKRINAITNAEIVFLKDGKSVEEMEDIIDTPEFEELIREIILHKAWGKSVIDISFNPEFNIFSVPRKNIRIDKMDRPLRERKRYILEKESDMTGYDYENDPYIIECGKDDDLGFLFKAAPYVIYKRGGFGDWAQFAEIFGMPFLIGKYNGFDPKAKERLFQALGEIGSNPRAAIPKEADLQVVPNNSNGSNTMYKELKDACNEEILLAVLGNTMTTLSGSSRSQSETHKETQQDIAKADRRYVQRILNRKLLPLLLKRGYPVAGGFFSFPDQGESISTDERLDMALKVKQAGIPVDDDYIYEITGIPKAEKQPDATGQNSPPGSGGVPDEGGGGEKPGAADSNPQKPASKKKGLRDFFALAPTSSAGAIANLWTSLTSFLADFTDSMNLSHAISKIYLSNVNLSDAPTPIAIGEINIAKLFQQALNEVYGGDTRPVNPNLFQITNTAIQQAFTVEFDKDDWGKGNAEFVNEFRKNGAFFSAYKAHTLTKEFESLVYDAEGKQKTFKQFVADSRAIQEQDIRHLRTQYNTAIKSTRAAINFRQYLKNEKLYPNLEYMESMAVNKRADHLEYVGTVLPIRHQWWETHMPPGGWNCQCWVRPTRKQATPVPAGELVPPVFQNNPGTSAKFILTEETPYYKNTEEKLRKTIENVAQKLEAERQRMEQNRLLYEELKKDDNYYDVKFSKKSGGLKATHKLHQFDPTKTSFNQKMTRGQYEKNSRDILFKNGFKVILEPETNTPGKKFEGFLNDVKFDIKGVEGYSNRNIREKLFDASKQKAETVVIYYPDIMFWNEGELKKQVKDYYRVSKTKRIKKVYYIVENKLFEHR